MFTTTEERIVAYKLTKATKTHIADMATRAKHKSAFEAVFQAFKDDAYRQLYAKYQNELFEGVNPVVLQACSHTNLVELYSDKIDVKDINTALQLGSDTINVVNFGNRVYGPKYRVYASDLDDTTALKALMAAVKEITEFRSALLAAMAPFKSGEKLIAALPWADQYYPEDDKKPTCNIVPVSVIEKANELMGIKE